MLFFFVEILKKVLINFEKLEIQIDFILILILNTIIPIYYIKIILK